MKKLKISGGTRPFNSSSIILSSLHYTISCSNSFSFDEEDETVSGLEKNLGVWGRLVRVIAGITLITLVFLQGGLSKLILLVVGIQAIYFVVTGLTGFCPAYAKVGVNTVNRAEYVHENTLKKNPD
ncbi:hypothetical protein BMS3Abin16_01027 [archaeon BMS3Abin16]|nr:hypothetical protein BMS3Abin16_01027 [archaeon BMS3Abin16]